MRLVIAWMVLMVLIAAGCRTKRPEILPQSPEEAFAELKKASQSTPPQVDQLFLVLDRKSRWSLMSVFKDRKQICKLVREHYPRARQARELQRCRMAASSESATAFFAAYARQHKLLEPLTRLGAISGRRGSAQRVELQSQGATLAFCKEPDGWFYCGFSDQLDQLKVKAARDLTTVQENVDAYRQAQQ
jgi:hypothetical protein